MRLCTIPGIEFTTAAVILAEVGYDMNRFADPEHLASWAGLCPGNNESAGKRFSGRTRKGNRYLRRILTQSAWSLKRKKNCFLTAMFWRVSARGGRKKAGLAVAHRILTIVWHIIAEGKTYQELGGDHYDRLHPERSARRLIRRLQQLGFEVDARCKAHPSEQSSESAAPSCAPPDREVTQCEGETRDEPRKSKPTIQAADAAVCRMCARWGIPCIHARNARRLRTPTLHSAESAT